MSYFIKRGLRAWLVGLLFLNGLLARAQSQPVVCDLNNLKPPQAYQGWNWETTPFDAAYCNTWAAQVSTGKILMGSPFNNPSSRPLIRISQSGDFKKADGWELVRLDFGGNSSTSMPNFILYNKYTGVLRVYAFVTTPQAFSSAIITMEHVAGVGGGRVSAVAGIGQELLRGSDKYQAQNLDDELTTYVCSYKGPNSWVMGEFNMLFDPNSAERGYYQSALEFTVYGILRSTVDLAGDIRFTTRPVDGYGFSGPKSQIMKAAGANNPTQFFVKGAKYLGQVDDVTKKLGNIFSSAEDIQKGLASKTGVLGRIGTSAGKIANASKDLKTALGAVSALGSFFGIAGAVLGILFPSDDGPQAAQAVPPTPTISTGSITLKGTIESNLVLGSTSTQVPGTLHNLIRPSNAFVRASQPYYDCPMGLFNLRRSPAVNATVSYVTCDYETGNCYSYIPFTAYTVANDLEPVFNATSGMELVSMKVAIMQKVRPSSLLEGNTLASAVSFGRLVASPFDPGKTSQPEDDTYLVHTPFVDIGCFKGMTYTAPSDSLEKSPAFVRVIVTLRQANRPNSAPYYFVQDYDIDKLGYNSVPDTEFEWPVGPPPYVAAFGLTVGYANPSSDVTWTGPLPPSQILAAYGPNLIFATPGSAASPPFQINPNQNNGRGGFWARQSIQFGRSATTGTYAELNVPVGSDFFMTTDFFFDRVCPTPGLSAQAAGVCGPNIYNTEATTSVQAPSPTSANEQADARAKATATATVELSPNPATQVTTVRLVDQQHEQTISRIEVLNLTGQTLWQSNSVPNGIKLEIPLRGLATGVYVVRVTATGGSYVERLIVE